MGSPACHTGCAARMASGSMLRAHPAKIANITKGNWLFIFAIKRKTQQMCFPGASTSDTGLARAAGTTRALPAICLARCANQIDCNMGNQYVSKSLAATSRAAGQFAQHLLSIICIRRLGPALRANVPRGARRRYELRKEYRGMDQLNAFAGIVLLCKLSLPAATARPRVDSNSAARTTQLATASSADNRQLALLPWPHRCRGS